MGNAIAERSRHWTCIVEVMGLNPLWSLAYFSPSKKFYPHFPRLKCFTAAKRGFLSLSGKLHDKLPIRTIKTCLRKINNCKGAMFVLSRVHSCFRIPTLDSALFFGFLNYHKKKSHINPKTYKYEQILLSLVKYHF